MNGSIENNETNAEKDETNVENNETNVGNNKANAEHIGPIAVIVVPTLELVNQVCEWSNKREREREREGEGAVRERA